MLAIKTEIGRAFTKSLTAAGKTARDAEAQLGVAAAGALGQAIRHRVSTGGDVAGQHVFSWDSWHKPKLVSPKYPDGAMRMQGPLREHRSGAIYYRDSEIYHEFVGAKKGAYNVTFGMWGGLSRVVWSQKFVELRFRGRSAGQDARIVNYKSRPLKVNNAFKAWTVLQTHGVNVLLLTERELAGLGRGATMTMAGGIGLPVNWGSSDGVLIASMLPSQHFEYSLGVRSSLQSVAPVA